MFVMNLKTCSKPQKMITIKTFMKVLKVCVILKGCKIIMQNRNKVFKQKKSPYYISSFKWSGLQYSGELNCPTM